MRTWRYANLEMHTDLSWNLRWLTCFGLAALCVCGGCAARDSIQASQPQNQIQADSEADRVTALRIRRAIVADELLSRAAHRVKIIVSSTGVTIRGPVRSEQERTTVRQKAAQIVGDPRKLTDQMTLKY